MLNIKTMMMNNNQFGVLHFINVPYKSDRTVFTNITSKPLLWNHAGVKVGRAQTS